ncbi:hypothetical protein Bhyg_12457 [Pseudolycoriella hygida]|uniref:Uncharacterized protein n=1 Tax=Pseudolycoriella hygida TaxID=35572 RepID=A0A9Q0MYY5_9DIPT|nr:hypothetical protein Bhyg_12457 [Pseudolycoriella hygida]
MASQGYLESIGAEDGIEDSMLIAADEKPVEERRPFMGSLQGELSKSKDLDCSESTTAKPIAAANGLNGSRKSKVFQVFLLSEAIFCKVVYSMKLKEEGKFDEFKKRNNANQKKRRERLSAGFVTLPRHDQMRIKRLNREYNRKKVTEHRQRKRQQHSTNAVVSATDNSVPKDIDDGSYKTKSALAKAVAKVKRALPSTVPKQKQVVLKILKSFGPNGLGDDKTTNKNKQSKGLSLSDIEMIKAFYQRDDISRISPNVKDCRKFVNPSTGVKEIQQLRYLQCKLIDVHALFVKHIKNGNDENKPPVKFSKFCELRPPFVKLARDTPLNQCLCLHHSNFMLCCTAIRKTLPEFPKYGSTLEKTILCKDSTQKCWLRKCDQCPNAKNVLANFVGKKRNKSVSWLKWIKHGETKRYTKVIVRGTLKRLVDYFLEQLPTFLRHSYIKRSQHASFEKDIEEAKSSNGEVAVFQADIAENYTCEAQNEIQSAHWHQATV